MQLLPRGHASHRHSAVDWSKPADQWPPELRSVRAYDVVQRPGDVLYLPQYHMHYIISLDRNLQCNSVRGRDLRETPKRGSVYNSGRTLNVHGRRRRSKYQ